MKEKSKEHCIFTKSDLDSNSNEIKKHLQAMLEDATSIDRRDYTNQLLLIFYKPKDNNFYAKISDYYDYETLTEYILERRPSRIWYIESNQDIEKYLLEAEKLL